MHIESLEVLNLWGRKKLAVDFKGQVTFLTGANGSGKSTILNIIYDFLAAHTKSNQLTTKTTFWSAKINFPEHRSSSRLVVPNTDNFDRVQLKSIIDSLSNSKNAKSHFFHDINNLEKLKKEFCTLNASNNISFAPFNEHYKGAIWYARDITPENEVNIPKAYIFQEDRSLSKNTISDNDYATSINDSLSGSYSRFRSTIDREFLRIREEFQTMEAHLNSTVSSVVSELTQKNKPLSELTNEDKFVIAQEKLGEISKLIDKINSYFISTNKIITRDDRKRLTLKFIDQSENEYISWDTLSRGEKMIIFIMLTVFINKDDNDIFLLDEPEIAMHVLWQERLIGDLIQIAPTCQFIIATHSPSLIEQGWLGHCVKVNVGNSW